MHTIIVMAGGLALLAVMPFLGKLGGFGISQAALRLTPIGLVCAAIDMWVGVSRAGCSAAAELPIFQLVFAVPATIALLVRSRLG